MKTVLDFIASNWLIISPLLLELILRLIPTEKSVSIFSLIFKFLDRVIPNLKKGGGQHLLIFLLFFSTLAYSQNDGNFRAIRMKAGNDTATFSPQPNGTILYGSNSLYFKTATNWVNMLSGNYNFSNGITLTGNNVKLGGNLIGDVDIEGNYDFVMGGNNIPLSFIGLTAGDVLYNNFCQMELRQNRLNFNNFFGGTFRGGLLIDQTGSSLKGGFNNGQGDTELKLGSNSTKSTFFKDSRTGTNQTGLEYFADYSNNYVARSIVDKNYSDSHVNGYTITNSPLSNQALTFNGSNLTWSTVGGGSGSIGTDVQKGDGSGGFLSADIVSTSTTKTLGLSSNTSPVQTLTTNGSGTNVGLNIVPKGTGTIQLQTGGSSISIANTFTNVVGGGFELQFNNNSLYFNNGSGSKLTVNNTANSFFGGGTLSFGTLNVSNTNISSTSIIFVSNTSSGGTVGALSVVKNNGVGFTINSTSNTDTSTVGYLIIN